MTSFHLPIDEKKRFTAEFFGQVLDELQRAFAQECADSGLGHNEIAARLGMDKGALSRRLRGESNLTLRTIAEIAYGLNRSINFTLNVCQSDVLSNGRHDYPKNFLGNLASATGFSQVAQKSAEKDLENGVVISYISPALINRVSGTIAYSELENYGCVR